VNLGLQPFKGRFVQLLTDNDRKLRQTFAERFLATHRDDMDDILWTDEANFTLHGEVTSLCGVVWAAENPHIRIQKPLHSEKVTVWLGMTARFVTPPFFFAGTVDGPSYLHMLQTHCIPFLKRHHAFSRTTFQQDGASPHTSNAVKQFLTATFSDKIISRGFTDPWPARSPDITPSDFWLWGHLKRAVFLRHPKDMKEMRCFIQEEVQQLDRDMLANVVHSIPIRLEKILQNHGGHIE
jgi:hypothetical protein